jgi:hypothetical protein
VGIAVEEVVLGANCGGKRCHDVSADACKSMNGVGSDEEARFVWR